MTVSVRCLIALSELPAWIARGWRECYRMPGGWRVKGEAVVVERDGPV